MLTVNACGQDGERRRLWKREEIQNTDLTYYFETNKNEVQLQIQCLSFNFN